MPAVPSIMLRERTKTDPRQSLCAACQHEPCRDARILNQAQRQKFLFSVYQKDGRLIQPAVNGLL